MSCSPCQTPRGPTPTPWPRRDSCPSMTTCCSLTPTADGLSPTSTAPWSSPTAHFCLTALSAEPGRSRGSEPPPPCTSSPLRRCPSRTAPPWPRRAPDCSPSPPAMRKPTTYGSPLLLDAATPRACLLWCMVHLLHHQRPPVAFRRGRGAAHHPTSFRMQVGCDLTNERATRICTASELPKSAVEGRGGR